MQVGIFLKKNSKGDGGPTLYVRARPYNIGVKEGDLRRRYPRRRGTPQKSLAPRHGAGRPRERSMIAGKLLNVKGMGPERSRRGYAAIGRF